MKLQIKPEQVYIVVFCFFAIGAGCKAAGEYAFDRLTADSAHEAQVLEQSRPTS